VSGRRPQVDGATKRRGVRHVLALKPEAGMTSDVLRRELRAVAEHSTPNFQHLYAARTI
jgi:hypothetical protein